MKIKRKDTTKVNKHDEKQKIFVYIWLGQNIK